MNYRHAFHAGNFADLLKHAALTLILEALSGRSAPMTVIDTHAGAGVYDLGGPEAQKSGEGAAGIGRLAASVETPEAFDMLLAAVARINPQGGVRFYPGSPMLIAAALREGDRLIACELRGEEYDQLAQLMEQAGPAVRVLNADGFFVAAEQSSQSGDALFVIDPPFERGNDYARVVETCAAVLRRQAAARFLIWMPLKDLETFDRILRDLEDIGAGSVLVAECRLRSLTDPLKMNGCALVMINPPAEVETPIAAAADWIASALGETGARGHVWRL